MTISPDNLKNEGFGTILKDLNAVPAGTFLVDNLASLATLSHDDGGFAYVKSLKRCFQRDASATEAPLEGQRVAAVGGGLWRSTSIFSSEAGPWIQTAWHIDPVAGHVENDGSAAHPINSWLELKTRIDGQQLLPNTVISIHGDLPEILDATHFIPPVDGLLVTGEPGATNILTGTVQTFTPEVLVAPGEAPVLRSAAVTDWTTLEGYRMRFLDGPAAGALSSVSRADPAGVGVNRARIPQPTLFDITNPLEQTYPSPVPTNTFVIEQLPVVLGYKSPSRALRGINSLYLRGFAFSETQPTNVSGTNSFFVGCTSGDITFNALEAFHIGCRYSSTPGLYTQLIGGKHWLVGCTIHWSLFEAFSTDAVHCVFQEGDYCFGGAHARHHCGGFDTPGDGLALASPGGSMFLFGTYYGSGNTDYGINVSYGGGVVSYTSKPVVTGVINNCRVAGVDKAWADIPFVGTNLAGIVTQ